MRRIISCLSILLFLTSCAYIVRLPFAVQKEDGPSRSFRGVLHIHTEYSHDSVASLKSLRRHARGAGLDFLILTDHNNVDALTSPDTEASDPVMIVGQEISTAAGHLLAVAPQEAINRKQSPSEIITAVHLAGGSAILSHPFSSKNPWKDPELRDYDGLEIYNFAHDFYPANKLKLTFQFLMLPPSFFLRHFQRIPQQALDHWDQVLLERPVYAYGGADAHIHFTVLGLPLESNRLALESVTTNIQSPSGSKEELLTAFKQGRTYLSFDYLGKADLFDFFAETGGGTRAFMGQTLVHSGNEGASLRIQLPGKGDIRIIHNAGIHTELRGVSGAEVEINSPGYYRAEIYRKGKLWIVSNPVFVRHE